MAQGPDLQKLIIELEGGSLAVWIQRTVLLALVVACTVFILTSKFQNFGNDDGFDQAQLARQISKGEGYTTQVVRPLQIWYMQQSGRVFDPSKMPEINQAPAYPYLNSVIFSFFKKDYLAQTRNFQMVVDRAVVLGAIVIFILAVGFVYAMGVKLFDASLALMSAGLCLVCNLFWDFAQACLPQLLLLLFFAALMFCLTMAMKEEYREDGQSRPLPWIIPLGILAALMTLTHGLAAWISAGLLISVLIFFRNRMLYATVVLLTYFAVLTPWFIRNYQVCGNPLGMAHFAFFNGINHSMDVWQSMFTPDFKSVSLGPIQKKIVYEASNQLYNIFGNMGFNLVAPLFFVSLLHPFRRREAGSIRWVLLVMFALTFLGMCLFSNNAKGISIDNLHLVFMPFFAMYGMAFLVVTWNRGMPAIPILRYTAITVLFVFCGLPMLTMLVTRTNPLKHWPPYLPTVMRFGADIATEKEALCADIPECVAYSSNRLTMKMPEDFNKFVEYIDYTSIRKPIVGLILTPRTGDARFLSEIAFGRYAKWAKFVMRHKELELGGFPLNKMVLLPPSFQNVIFIDSDRYDKLQNRGKVPEETNKAALPTESEVVPIPPAEGAPAPDADAGPATIPTPPPATEPSATP